ncbi:MAG: ribosome biogenesis GTP-binding protein YsxC [Gammaproteobacteria bacterium]|nr:ribosome biogenesis GTP-binding protein YihA/YsxC [Gammaproteobacteria bacterium]MXX95984.1 ribosome biogenesis GTP-binding protein YsxC [Gammaproteobacteria bacterium]MYF52633.1 ribosome biogenesis GTP-binding protein YsxC [Gammaproteobacteria bacterium]MYK42595.1 ribosome biogenesis GTP-binding protein YsxC [Gammaproteobacteria bacterium]
MSNTKLFHANFLKSALNLRDCPLDETIEIAFVGRSNAGKSSTLNRITGEKQLARVSKTPGRTQLLNFFTVEGEGRFVDLPGYGYAKAAKTQREIWGQTVDQFLEQRKNLVGLVLVTDIRRTIPTVDQDMIAWASTREIPMLVILNKVDKAKQQEKDLAQRAAKLLAQEHPHATFLVFSAKTNLGLQAVVSQIRAMFNT